MDQPVKFKPDYKDAFFRLLGWLDSHASNTAAQDRDHHPDQFHYIPLGRSYFVKNLGKALRRFKKVSPGVEPSFVDVGCGLGTKVLLAKTIFGIKAQGIEISERMCQMARTHLGLRFTCSSSHPLDPADIIRIDAMKADYSAYNVIYSYQPFINEELQNELDLRIWSQILPGSIFYREALFAPPDKIGKHMLCSAPKLYEKPNE